MFLQLLIILGSLQGLVTAALLYYKKPRQLPNKLLAAIVLLIALPGIHLYGHNTGLFNGSRAADIFHALIPWVTVMAIGPLLYWYVRASINPSFHISGRQWLHLLPVVIDLFPKIMELLFLAGGLAAWSRAEFMDFLDTYNKYADIPRWISLACYVQLSGNMLSAAGSPGMAGNRLRRLIIALKIFAVIWLAYLIPYLVPASNAVLQATVGWLPVYIPMSVLIYFTGITALYDTGAKAIRKTEPAYPPALLTQTLQQLINSMESGQAYLDPKLDLPRLAERLQVPAKLVSATVNQLMDKSFNQFINEYRIQAFQRKVLEPGANNMTITGLAASCGFHSPATFQRSFKQVTGLTPSAFIRIAAREASQKNRIPVR
jgi:AraC-like DNA-binding protein